MTDLFTVTIIFVLVMVAALITAVIVWPSRKPKTYELDGADIIKALGGKHD